MNSETDITNGLSTKQTKDLSLKFQRGAIQFILFSAVPYMLQIVLFGAMNMWVLFYYFPPYPFSSFIPLTSCFSCRYAYNCFRDDLHRTVRLTEMFRMDGSRFVATATLGSTQYSPGSTYDVICHEYIPVITGLKHLTNIFSWTLYSSLCNTHGNGCFNGLHHV